MQFDVFNGDADGICSLLQLRLENPIESQLVTGIKRDIALLERVAAEAGDHVTVLDLSMVKNRDALDRLLAAGVSVDYVDHHAAGEIPDHVGLTATISEAPEVCTALLVNGRLRGAQVAWAVTGAFGDNLDEPASQVARKAGFSELDTAQLRELGICLNYNGYGPSLDELHFHPADYEALYDARSPATFAASDACTGDGYREEGFPARNASARPARFAHYPMHPGRGGSVGCSVMIWCARIRVVPTRC